MKNRETSYSGLIFVLLIMGIMFLLVGIDEVRNSNYNTGILGVLLGTTMLMLSVVFFDYSRKRKEAQENLKNSGVTVKGVVIKIKETGGWPLIPIRRVTDYRIIFEYKDPISHETKRGTSGSLRFKPSINKGDQIDIVVNPNKKNCYMIKSEEIPFNKNSWFKFKWY
ncbi:MAG: hypothetical protein QF741_00355 [Candidatus Peribacteraceae bacterium]|nr:hypothetical protein [Candidatus Peribacteraceae bacterium]MDP7645693.1 hypothetical protein [Candidatus Peribacteraceae bacterium]